MLAIKIYFLPKQPMHVLLTLYRCNVIDMSCFPILPSLLCWLRGFLLWPTRAQEVLDLVRNRNVRDGVNGCQLGWGLGLGEGPVPLQLLGVKVLLDCRHDVLLKEGGGEDCLTQLIHALWHCHFRSLSIFNFLVLFGFSHRWNGDVGQWLNISKLKRCFLLIDENIYANCHFVKYKHFLPESLPVSPFGHRFFLL